MMRRVVSLELFCLEDGYLSANRFNLSFSHELKLFENMMKLILNCKLLILQYSMLISRISVQTEYILTGIIMQKYHIF